MPMIVPNTAARTRSYMWAGISVTPNPPRLGEAAKISFPLLNPGPDELVIERIEVKVARFGMGVKWDVLPPLGPYMLAPDSRHSEEAVIEWIPDAAGHRCVRASIHTRGQRDPLLLGQNMYVVHSEAAVSAWRVPFRLGNPTPTRAPIRLRLSGDDERLETLVRIGGETVPMRAPIWLEAGQEVEAELALSARDEGALDHARTVEATVNGRFIDGIYVAVRRPARRAIESPSIAWPRSWRDQPGMPVDEDMLVLA
ncbi:MAG: hypothetical protein IVW57_04030 [Ktedonobacterales bacterium]|nr:hypothetical protein [Ktedonobacterales bacterium]